MMQATGKALCFSSQQRYVCQNYHLITWDNGSWWLFSSAVLKLYRCYPHGLSSSGAVKELVQVSFLLCCNSRCVEKYCSIPILGSCLGPERGRRWLFLDHRVSHLKETKPFPALTLLKESQENVLLTLCRLGRSKSVKCEGYRGTQTFAFLWSSWCLTDCAFSKDLQATALDIVRFHYVCMILWFVFSILVLWKL